MLTQSPDFSVVLPTYQEAENLQVLLPRIRQVLEDVAKPYEILVIDTPAPMDEAASICKLNEVRYINRTPGTCFGDAVRTGIREARGRWILFMDSDGSHSPEFIPELIKNAGGFDVVIASRYMPGGGTENSRLLVFMSRVLNVSYNLILGLNVRDVSNGFKIYPLHLLRELSLRCDNFDIIEEMLFKLKRIRPNLKIQEIPYTFKKRMFGKTKRNLALFLLTYLYTILRLRLSVHKTIRNNPNSN